jgi:metal-responsive CopG/Arc/MetJ family transcriptional regulator
VRISVWIDENSRRLLARLARSQRVSRSEVVRRALRQFAEHDSATEDVDVYGRIKHLIGSDRTGRSDLCQRTGEQFRKILLEEWKQRENDSHRRRPSRRDHRR